MDLYDQAKDAMGALERVVAGVPGYKGYKEKELRRESDKRLREVVAKQLDDQKQRLDGIQMEMVGGGQLALLDDVENVNKKLQLLIDRIRTASYGYAPFFDLVRVKEAQLDALAEFDQGLFAGVDRIKTVIDNMETLSGRPDSEWKEAIRALNTVVAGMNTDFSHRDEVILQAGALGEEAAVTDVEAVEESDDDEGGLLDKLFGRD